MGYLSLKHQPVAVGTKHMLADINETARNFGLNAKMRGENAQ